MLFGVWQLKTTVYVLLLASSLGQELVRTCDRDYCYERSRERRSIESNDLRDRYRLENIERNKFIRDFGERERIDERIHETSERRIERENLPVHRLREETRRELIRFDRESVSDSSDVTRRLSNNFERQREPELSQNRLENDQERIESFETLKRVDESVDRRDEGRRLDRNQEDLNGSFRHFGERLENQEESRIQPLRQMNERLEHKVERSEHSRRHEEERSEVLRRHDERENKRDIVNRSYNQERIERLDTLKRVDGSKERRDRNQDRNFRQLDERSERKVEHSEHSRRYEEKREEEQLEGLRRHDEQENQRDIMNRSYRNRDEKQQLNLRQLNNRSYNIRETRRINEEVSRRHDDREDQRDINKRLNGGEKRQLNERTRNNREQQREDFLSRHENRREYLQQLNERQVNPNMYGRVDNIRENRQINQRDEERYDSSPIHDVENRRDSSKLSNDNYEEQLRGENLRQFNGDLSMRRFNDARESRNREELRSQELFRRQDPYQRDLSQRSENILSEDKHVQRLTQSDRTLEQFDARKDDNRRSYKQRRDSSNERREREEQRYGPTIYINDRTNQRDIRIRSEDIRFNDKQEQRYAESFRRERESAEHRYERKGLERYDTLMRYEDSRQSDDNSRISSENIQSEDKQNRRINERVQEDRDATDNRNKNERIERLNILKQRETDVRSLENDDSREERREILTRYRETESQRIETSRRINDSNEHLEEQRRQFPERKIQHDQSSVDTISSRRLDERLAVREIEVSERRDDNRRESNERKYVRENVKQRELNRRLDTRVSQVVRERLPQSDNASIMQRYVNTEKRESRKYNENNSHEDKLGLNRHIKDIGRENLRQLVQRRETQRDFRRQEKLAINLDGNLHERERRDDLRREHERFLVRERESTQEFREDSIQQERLLQTKREQEMERREDSRREKESVSVERRDVDQLERCKDARRELTQHRNFDERESRENFLREQGKERREDSRREQVMERREDSRREQEMERREDSRREQKQNIERVYESTQHRNAGQRERSEDSREQDNFQREEERSNEQMRESREQLLERERQSRWSQEQRRSNEQQRFLKRERETNQRRNTEQYGNRKDIRGEEKLELTQYSNADTQDNAERLERREVIRFDRQTRFDNNREERKYLVDQRRNENKQQREMRHETRIENRERNLLGNYNRINYRYIEDDAAEKSTVFLKKGYMFLGQGVILAFVIMKTLNGKDDIKQQVPLKLREAVAMMGF